MESMHQIAPIQTSDPNLPRGVGVNGAFNASQHEVLVNHHPNKNMPPILVKYKSDYVKKRDSKFTEKQICSQKKAAAVIATYQSLNQNQNLSRRERRKIEKMAKMDTSHFKPYLNPTGSSLQNCTTIMNAQQYCKNEDDMMCMPEDNQNQIGDGEKVLESDDCESISKVKVSDKQAQTSICSQKEEPRPIPIEPKSPEITSARECLFCIAKKMFLASNNECVTKSKVAKRFEMIQNFEPDTFHSQKLSISVNLLVPKKRREITLERSPSQEQEEESHKKPDTTVAEQTQLFQSP